MMRIVCSSCQRDTARKDGPKTPTGKAICQSCKEKIEARLLVKDKRNSSASSSTLKNHPDRWCDSILKQCRKEATHEQIDALLPVETPPVTQVMDAIETFLSDGDAFDDLVAAYKNYKKATA